MPSQYFMKNTLALRKKCEEINLKSLYKRYEQLPRPPETPPFSPSMDFKEKGQNVFNCLPSLPISSVSLPCNSPGQHCSLQCCTSLDAAGKHLDKQRTAGSQHIPGDRAAPPCWALAVTLEPQSLGSGEHVQPLAYNPAIQSPHSHVGHPFPPPRLPTLGTNLTHLL